MKRAVMIILACILLCFPFLMTGCAEDVPTITRADVDKWINESQTIKDLQATKASTADVATAKNQADAAKARADAAYAKAENVTALAVSVSSLNFDNLTDAQITALKNKLGITSGGSSGDSGDTNSDQLIDENKDLALYLTEINPSTDPLYLGTSTNMRFEFVVKNKSTTNSRNFKIVISLSPEESVSIQPGTSFDIYSDVSMAINADITAAVAVAADGSYTINCLSGWVGKGDTESITVLVNFLTNNSSAWNYNIDIIQTT